MDYNFQPQKIKILGRNKHKIRVQFLGRPMRNGGEVAMSKRFVKKRLDLGLFELEDSQMSSELI
ncbi:MAG TPA: hypothetical protein VJ917_06965 [Saprospiraceae bacterium]|nr:hypothetical protein [Saprospiraceae bacterium]